MRMKRLQLLGQSIYPSFCDRALNPHVPVYPAADGFLFQDFGLAEAIGRVVVVLLFLTVIPCNSTYCVRAVWKTVIQKKDTGIVLDKLNTSQQCMCVMKTSCMLGCSRKNVDSRLREVHFFVIFCYHLLVCSWSTMSNFGLPAQERCCPQSLQCGVTKMIAGAMIHEEGLKCLDLFTLEGSGVILVLSSDAQWEVIEKTSLRVVQSKKEKQRAQVTKEI